MSEYVNGRHVAFIRDGVRFFEGDRVEGHIVTRGYYPKVDGWGRDVPVETVVDGWGRDVAKRVEPDPADFYQSDLKVVGPITFAVDRGDYWVENELHPHGRHALYSFTTLVVLHSVVTVTPAGPAA